VSTFQGTPERLDDVLLYVKDEVVPELSKAEGFKGLATHVNRSNGKFMSMSFWDAREDMERSRQVADELRAKGAEALGASLLSVDEYEVGQRLDAAGKATLHLSE
jgi:hypothetical protein